MDCTTEVVLRLVEQSCLIFYIMGWILRASHFIQMAFHIGTSLYTSAIGDPFTKSI